MEERKLLCDLCSKPASSSGRDGNQDGNCSKQFIQLLSKFLKIRSRFVEVGGRLVICNDCFELGKSFCDLYSQWEYLRLQLEWRVRELFDIISDVVQTSTASDENDMLGLGGDITGVSSEIKNLTRELLKGCKNKLNSSLPRIALQKVTREKEKESVVENTSIKCAALSTRSFSDSDKLQFMIGMLMSFVAVSHLSISFDSQKSSKTHNQPQQESRNLGFDQQLQTNSTTDEKQAENENGAVPPMNPNKRKRPSTPKVVDLEKNVDKEFKCSKCAKEFDEEIWLNVHIQVHHSILSRQDEQHIDNSMNDIRIDPDPETARETISVCQSNSVPNATPRSSNCHICQSTFDSQVLLALHLRDVHQIQASFQCPLCGSRKKCARKFRAHMKLVHNTVSGLPGSFKCPKCEERYTNDVGLKVHLAKTHQFYLGRLRLKCVKCSQRFVSKAKLQTHTYQMHERNQNEQRMKRFRKITSRKKSTAASSSFALPASNSSIRMETVVPPGPSTSKATIRPTKNKPGQSKSFHCDFEGCIQQFKTTFNLKRHQRVHTREKPYQCWWPGCSSMFTTSDNRLRHYRSMHSIDKGLPQNSKEHEQRVTTKLMHMHIKGLSEGVKMLRKRTNKKLKQDGSR